MDFYGLKQVHGFLMTFKKKSPLLSGCDQGHVGFI